MKLIHPTLAIGMSSALLFGTTPGVSAQAQLGVHGNLSDVVDFNWGVGGRLGFVTVKSRVVCKSERKLLDASVRLPWRPPSVREA